MTISTTYRRMLIDDFIKSQLQQGESITAETILNYVQTELADLDLDIPQFAADPFLIERLENSSASKAKNTLLVMQQDIRALYKNLLLLTQVSIDSVERWNLESIELERKLVELENRIQNLLILTQDTEGYFSIIVEDFANSSLVDKFWTTTEVNLDTQTVDLATSIGNYQRILLNNLDPVEDLSFRVRSTANFLSRNDEVNTDISGPFKQTTESWWTNLTMKAPGAVTCELTVRLDPVNTIDVSKIILDLHDSSEASPVTITPLWSVDNVTYNQIPSNTFVLEARSSATFTFSTISAKFFKFILTKQGPDLSSGTDIFGYQFGFKNIKFYTQSFSIEDVQYLISKPLFILDSDGIPIQFEKITLETCERVEINTDIRYYFTFSNDPTVPLDTNESIEDAALWFPITPINRATKIYPSVLDIGDVSEFIIEDAKISYSGRADDENFINPAETFNLLSEDSGTGQVNTDTITALAPRYSFINQNDRILNYQIKLTDYVGSGSGEALDVKEDSLLIFRNIGSKGIDATDPTSKVRNIQKGWGFIDPYYYCVIEIENPEGIEIDVGDRPIIIDDVSYTNKVSSEVLTGKSLNSTGIHRVKVHKANWREVTPTLGSLAALRAADPLYPFNHKLLIEGYAYSISYPDTEEQIYQGVDLFAEFQMRRVSSFDLLYNIASYNYTVYALDLDAPNTHEGTGAGPDINDPTRVFLVKVDDSNPDLENEEYTIKFNQINLLQTYMRLRADFTTTDSTITPSLDGYKIKVG